MAYSPLEGHRDIHLSPCQLVGTDKCNIEVESADRERDGFCYKWEEEEDLLKVCSEARKMC